jgi:hypothetical protein
MGRYQERKLEAALILGWIAYGARSSFKVKPYGNLNDRKTPRRSSAAPRA